MRSCSRAELARRADMSDESPRGALPPCPAGLPRFRDPAACRIVALTLRQALPLGTTGYATHWRRQASLSHQTRARPLGCRRPPFLPPQRFCRDTWRWQGVPFFIRAGKSLPVTCTEVLVRLRRTPKLFPAANAEGNHFRFRVSLETTRRSASTQWTMTTNRSASGPSCGRVTVPDPMKWRHTSAC